VLRRPANDRGTQRKLGVRLTRSERVFSCSPLKNRLSPENGELNQTEGLYAIGRMRQPEE
jgi:hypothetical protein